MAQHGKPRGSFSLHGMLRWGGHVNRADHLGQSSCSSILGLTAAILSGEKSRGRRSLEHVANSHAHSDRGTMSFGSPRELLIDDLPVPRTRPDATYQGMTERRQDHIRSLTGRSVYAPLLPTDNVSDELLPIKRTIIKVHTRNDITWHDAKESRGPFYWLDGQSRFLVPPLSRRMSCIQPLSPASRRTQPSQALGFGSLGVTIDTTPPPRCAKPCMAGRAPGRLARPSRRRRSVSRFGRLQSHLRGRLQHDAPET